MAIKIPPLTNNAEGNQRKVGFELEFAGMELEQTAEVIQSIYGGEIQKKHRYEFDVIETRHGDFKVELDARILHKMAGRDYFEKLGFALDEKNIRESIEEVLDKLAMKVVPLEVVMPPVKIENLGEMEVLREQLQKNKAEGTKVSLVNAFGMHINIETPSLHVETLLGYLRAFLLLYPWLLEKLDIDISRRISPFVDPFPNVYVEKVLDVNYTPDQKKLVGDYLHFNATRNRPLDMMPIFALFDNERVQDAIRGEKNNPRPTFHYRLPNSKINDPKWTFMNEWNYWCVVEKLAVDSEMISKLSRLYLLRRGKTLVSFKKEWAETLRILLDLDE